MLVHYFYNNYVGAYEVTQVKVIKINNIIGNTF